MGSTWNGARVPGVCSTGNVLSDSLYRAGDLLESGLSELGFAVDPGVTEALMGLAQLLESWSQRINLTAHRSLESIVARLILDAAALERVLPRACRIVDLGSGAGFPGLPLAVLRSDAEILLVEAREKRHHFQRAAIRRLGMGTVRALRGRAERIAPEPGSLVVAQALAAPGQALDLALPWCEPGGWIALPGSPASPDPASSPTIDLAERRPYTVPGGGPARTVWLGRRIASS